MPCRVHSLTRARVGLLQVLYFAYGANLSFETLRKRDCRIEQRYSAFVVDPQIKLVFQHRGGERRSDLIKR